MRSPTVAMLWEIWRVTRTEIAWKLGIGIVGALAALVLIGDLAPEKKEAAVVIAMIFLVVPNSFAWVSLGFLNSGRPGFPLRLLYARPVRMAVMVGLPMAYLSAVSAATYLVSALVLKLALDYPIPLLPVAAWIVGFNLIQLSNNWSSSKTAVMHVAGTVTTTAWMLFAIYRLVTFPVSFSDPKSWLASFELPLSDYALIALVGLACFGITVARVARQRHGDASADLPFTEAAGMRAWLINLFSVACPDSSATRAQVWFDLKSNGVPLLTIGVALAILYPLLISVTGAIDAAIAELLPAVPCSYGLCMYTRVFAVLFAMLFPVLVMAMGTNAFGIRRSQGRTYVSAFEVAQPFGTAQLAGIKILVKSACVLAALIAVSASVWASVSTFSFLEEETLFIEIAGALSSGQREVEGAVAALSGYEKLALAVVAVAGVVVWVAALAALAALCHRYSRRAIITTLVLVSYGLALVLLVRAGRYGLAPVFLVDAVLAATRWLAVAAMVFATVYLVWRVFAERLMTIRYACGVVAFTAAFGAAWLTVQQAANATLMLWPVLLPLMASVLAPWSLNRLRHS